MVDCFVKNLVIVEAAAHFDQGFRNPDDARIGLTRRRRTVINETVGVQNPLIIAPSAIGRRPSIQRFAHALGGGETLTRPRIGMSRPGVSGQRRKYAENGEYEKGRPQITLAQ